MFGKKQWPLYAFLGLAVIMAGCKKKVEPQLPIVIVEKPVKKDVQIYGEYVGTIKACLLYTSPSPRDGLLSRMPSSA